MNKQLSELIERQESVVATQEKVLAEAKLVLENLKESAALWEAAESAQRKIEEGQRELQEAIAQMPPEVAALWQPTPAEEQTTVPTSPPDSSTQEEVNKDKDDDDEEKVDKAIAYIDRGKHETNKTGLLRISMPVLQKAAARLGVVAADSQTKKEIADAIAQALEHPTSEYVCSTETPAFQPGEMVQTSQGQIGEVINCVKKQEDGRSASDSSVSEPTTYSGSLPANSESTTTAINSDNPENGTVAIPDAMPSLQPA